MATLATLDFKPGHTLLSVVAGIEIEQLQSVLCDEIEVVFSTVGITRQKDSGKKELVYYPEAEHCTVDFLDEVFPYIVDWLRRHLAGAEAGG